MVDIRQELEKKILESNARQMSLSDRLNYLDNYNKDVAIPQISSEGPQGYNPMNSLNSLFQMISNRKAVASDLGTERGTGLSALSELANYEAVNQPKEPSASDLLNGIKEGLTWENGKWVTSGNGMPTATPAVKSYVDRIVAGDMKFTEVPTDQKDAVVVELSNRPLSTDEKQTITGIMKEISEYRKLMNPGKFAGLIPLSPKKAEINTKRKLLGMEIARLYEKGRLSDQDRQFYLSMLPDAVTPVDTANTALDALEASMRARYSKYLSGDQTTTDNQSGLDTADETLIQKYKNAGK